MERAMHDEASPPPAAGARDDAQDAPRRAAPEGTRGSAPTIALLGGGPVGLATAILLAQAGFDATVFDARPLDGARADRRLLALSRGTLQLLRPLLASQAPPMAPIVDVHVSSAGEFGTTRIDARDVDAGAADAQEPLGATVYYGDLVVALAAAAAAEPGVTVRRPLQVGRVDQRSDGVTLHLRGDGGAASTMAAALAIHAEGAPAAGTEASIAAWALVAELQLRGAGAGTAFERFTREGPLALLPAPSTRGPAWSLVWCMGEEAARRRSALDDDAFRAELQQAVGPRIAQVARVGARRAVPLPQQLRARVAEQRVVWIGNAAQTLHPVAGQGLNLGLRDAHTLVDALARRRSDLPGALADYAQRRAADRRLVAAVTRWMPGLFAARALPLSLARSLGLTALDLLPGLRREWARLLMFGVRR
jgi:2-octaprenyl-6-methoxyphenol hydroxylase